MLTDITGAVTDTYDYDAWGNIVSSTGLTPNVYLYRGEQYDPDLQLYYLRARYFNPLTGRFLSRDAAPGYKVFPISLHRYLYASANPINRRDPRGRQDMFEDSLLTARAVTRAQVLAGLGCAVALVDIIVHYTLAHATPFDDKWGVAGFMNTLVGCGQVAVFEEMSPLVGAVQCGVSLLGLIHEWDVAKNDAEVTAAEFAAGDTLLGCAFAFAGE
jgi:RHS repeat-associated protein